MKRLFYFLILLCAVFNFSACTNSTDIDNIQAPASEVNLYFGAAKIAATRAVDVNGNMWTNMPEYPTEEEKQEVLQYVQNNPGANVAWPGYAYYFVQHLVGAHHKYEYIDKTEISIQILTELLI